MSREKKNIILIKEHALNREPVPLCRYTTQSILRTFRVFFYTKIRDRIKNPDHYDFLLRIKKR